MSYLTFDSEDNQRKPFELPGAKPHYNPDRPGQVNHIFLDITLDIAQQSLQGICQITLTPVHSGIKTLILDAVNLSIESILVNNINHPFQYDKKQITLPLLTPTTDYPLILSITYSLKHPKRGIYFIQPDEYYPQKPIQVWTQGEDEDSRYWFPCFDYPGQLATSEIKVTIPKPYIAISNGELITTQDLGENQSFHWIQKQIHPSYLMTLAVGDFSEIKDSCKTTSVTYYVTKGKENQAVLSMGKTPRMIEFFSQLYGYPYPYAKYAQVCVSDFTFGGMENTSTTLLTDRCLLDEKASLDNYNTESLVAHELAHQWFGDLVVIKHWSQAWIKEGAASYSEVQWTEYEYGKDAGKYYLLKEMRSYLEEDSSRYRRPIVTHIYRAPIELYDCHLYEKGACVYHMIRTELGDELFNRFIRTFLEDYAHKTVETVDLLRSIEKATGKNLAPLFDQYVYRGGHPDFKVSYSWDNDIHLAVVRVQQTQAKTDSTASDSELFDLKIPFGFGYKKGEMKQFLVRVSQREQSFYFSLENKPDYFSFDLGNNYLKTVELDYSFPDLKAQIQLDSDILSRIYAGVALGRKGGIEGVEILGQVLQSDPFWGVRVEVAQQLGMIQLHQSITALKAGLEDSDPRVRRAVVEALGGLKMTESYEIIKQKLLAGDESYYVEASCARVLGGMVVGVLKEKENEVISLLKMVLETKEGWNEVIRCGAISGLAQMTTSESALEVILPYSQRGVNSPLRFASIRALGAISVGQKFDKVTLILEVLDSIATESDFHTQITLIRALEQMETEGALSILSAISCQNEEDSRLKRFTEEAMKKVKDNLGSETNLKALREEVDRLKQSNQDLQSRLAKLEETSKSTLS